MHIVQLFVFALAALTGDFVRAEHIENVPHTKPGENTVYMVLMPGTDMAHVTEMPSMARCLEAIRYVTRARCIEAAKPASGDFPRVILGLIPPPDDVPE